VAQRAHIILLVYSVFVSIVMTIDFTAFTWLHVVASELDFLCSSSFLSQDCGVLDFDGYMGDRVALLATIIGLHAFLTVRVNCIAFKSQEHDMANDEDRMGLGFRV
jgi:hypothetical protein